MMVIDTKEPRNKDWLNLNALYLKYLNKASGNISENSTGDKVGRDHSRQLSRQVTVSASHAGRKYGNLCANRLVHT